MAELYLIRHGIAAERGTYAVDGDRPLTDAGRVKTRKVAQRLYDLDLRFELILTSPLVRARQTAEILQAAGLCSQLEVNNTLAPDGALSDWLTWFSHWQQRHSSGQLALVGHQPELADWAELLVWGRSHQRIMLKKAGIIGLALPQGTSALGTGHLTWLTPPRLLL